MLLQESAFELIMNPPHFLIQIFAGNTDADTVVSHDLNPSITARYVRFRPITWQYWISMRVELYGCIQGRVNSGVHRLNCIMFS